MFERYTERARRVLFFARYEASQLGSISIEPEHLLLGLMREGKGLTARIFARSNLSFEHIRREIEGRMVFREKVSTSVEIPFSAEAKRVLGYTAEEADRLRHNHIGTEHLLLGLLREERSLASTILTEKGLEPERVRKDIVQLLNEEGGGKTHLDVTVEQETQHRNRPLFNQTLPDYLPSRVVHITHAHSFYSPTAEPAMAHGAHSWFALGRTVAQIVALAWGAEESRVELATERIDGNARYDFTIALPSTDSPEIIPRLLREAIERDFNVEVVREEGDPPTLIIKSR